MIVDTHCHLDFKEFDHDREKALERAREAGVLYLINVGSSLVGSERACKLASTHDSIFATVGVHPHHAEEVTEEVFSKIESLAKNKKVVAIGEVGLDYCKSPSPPGKQKEIFIRFIKLAANLKLPLIIHNRDAALDTLEILKSNCGFPVPGVMHCFSGDRKVLKQVLDLGMYVSFTCNLTFKNAKNLQEVAKYVPLNRLFLETDAPFLAPQAYRGKRNEPAYITELCTELSFILNLPGEEIEEATTENANRFFKLSI